MGQTTDSDVIEAQNEMPNKKDVSDYSTAAGAAKSTAKALTEWAEFYGHDSEGVTVFNPTETAEKRDMIGDVDCWTVVWENGPNNWATALTGGESMHAFTAHGEFGNEPEVSGLLDSDEFQVECYYSFDMQFFNK